MEVDPSETPSAPPPAVSATTRTRSSRFDDRGPAATSYLAASTLLIKEDIFNLNSLETGPNEVKGAEKPSPPPKATAVTAAVVGGGGGGDKRRHRSSSAASSRSSASRSRSRETRNKNRKVVSSLAVAVTTKSGSGAKEDTAQRRSHRHRHSSTSHDSRHRKHRRHRKTRRRSSSSPSSHNSSTSADKKKTSRSATPISPSAFKPSDATKTTATISDETPPPAPAQISSRSPSSVKKTVERESEGDNASKTTQRRVRSHSRSRSTSTTSSASSSASSPSSSSSSSPSSRSRSRTKSSSVVSEQRKRRHHQDRGSAAAAVTSRKRRDRRSSSRRRHRARTGAGRESHHQDHRSVSRRSKTGGDSSPSRSRTRTRTRTRSRDRRGGAYYHRQDYGGSDYSDSKRYYDQRYGSASSSKRYYGSSSSEYHRAWSAARGSRGGGADSRYYASSAGYYDKSRLAAYPPAYDYSDSKGYDYYDYDPAYYDYYYKEAAVGAAKPYYIPGDDHASALATGAHEMPPMPRPPITPPPPGSPEAPSLPPLSNGPAVPAGRFVKTPPLPPEDDEQATSVKTAPKPVAGVEDGGQMSNSCYLYDDLKIEPTATNKKPMPVPVPPPPILPPNDTVYTADELMNQCQEISSSTLPPGQYAQHHPAYYDRSHYPPPHDHHWYHHHGYHGGGHHYPPSDRHAGYDAYRAEYDWSSYYHDYAREPRSSGGYVDPPYSAAKVAAKDPGAYYDPPDAVPPPKNPSGDYEEHALRKGGEKAPPARDDYEDILAYKELLHSELKQSLFKDKDTGAAASTGSKATGPDVVASPTASRGKRAGSAAALNTSSHSEEAAGGETSKRSKHRRDKERHHKKPKKEKSREKEKESKLAIKKTAASDESFDSQQDSLIDMNKLLDDEACLRRSDRIRTIETKRQYTKEQEIAEKIRKHHGHHRHHRVGDEELSNDGIIKEAPVTPPEPPAPENQDGPAEPDADHQWREKERSTPASPVDEPSGTPPPPSSQGAAKPENNSSHETAVLSPNVKSEAYFGKDYQQIDENIYHSKKKRKSKLKKDAKRMTCDCSTSEQERAMGIRACGEDCLNRLLMIECGKRCPCGDYCTNRSFQRRLRAPVVPIKTELKGWGLKALIDLKPNTFLIEYVGEVIGLKEFKRRCEKYSAQNNQHFYFMSLYNDLFIDATRKGNVSRFFNHSCDPNCETQKWTVNGELRIGFFTRRAIGANEELTFDYQFQTFGKKQQKCYCGSEKCRGYLGASASSNGTTNSSSGQSLEQIWNQAEESSGGEEEDDDEEEEDEEEDGQRAVKKPSTSKTSSPEKATKGSAQKSKRDDKDHDINRQISSIGSLSNKESVLNLCRIMYRTENLENRIDLLNLLLTSKTDASLRLFIDYHGLKLLLNWMIDLDNHYESLAFVDCKTKILQVLSKMPIKNRNVLDECKLPTLVKRWSEAADHSKDIASPDDHQGEATDQAWLGKLVQNLADEAVTKSSASTDESELQAALRSLNDQARDLFTKWSNLEQSFKIPKKQRIRERKEHERELGSLVKSPLDVGDEDETFSAGREPPYPYPPYPTASSHSPSSSHASYSQQSSMAYYDHLAAKYDQSYYYDYYARGGGADYQYDTSDYYYHQAYRNSGGRRSYGSSSGYGNGYYPPTSRRAYNPRYDRDRDRDRDYRGSANLSKEERRRMFEESIKQQEAEAAAASATNAASGLDGESGGAYSSTMDAAGGANHEAHQGQEMKWVFDHQKQQWIQCYVPVNPAAPSMQQLYHQAGQYGAKGAQSFEGSAGRGQSQDLPPSSAAISLTDSHFNHIKQAMLNFMPSSGEPAAAPHKSLLNEVKTILSPSPTTSISPLDAMVVSIKNKLDRDHHQSEAAKEENQHAQLEVLASKLPPDWKCKANKAGRIYYYNLKTQQTQWEFPKPSKSSQKAPKKESGEEAVKPSVEESSTITSTTNESKNAADELRTSQETSSKPSESNMLTSSSTDASFKIFKDQFREKLSKLVISLLQPYLKKDCKIGHIASTDDFKHLARKFTHAIMEKEMSRATKLEELDLNKRIRIKTEEYVSKYMAKFTTGYLRDDQTMTL